MAENSFIKGVNCAKRKIRGIEEKNHYVSNILMVAALTLIILFTLLGGANVNVGSTYKGDGKDANVRQSFFQLVDAALSSSMTEIEAQEYVDKVESKLNSYGVLAPLTDKGSFHSLDFSSLLADAKNKMKGDVTDVNWIKYKHALSVLVGNTNSDAHKASWDGHVAVMVAGQAIFESLLRFAICLIALVMLVFAVIALVKRKKFTKARFALSLLFVCFFGCMIFSFGFVRPDALMILALVLIPLTAALYALLAHACMDNHELSLTMLLHNGVMLLGCIITFVFMTSPLFKVTNNYNVSKSYGWNFLFDLLLGEGAYMAVPMSYFLSALIMSILLLLGQVVCSAIIISTLNKFMAANYQHNDKRPLLIIMGVHTFIITLLIGISSLNGQLKISSLDLNAKVRAVFLVLQLLTIGGMIAFTYLFKPKPIKKEFVIKDAAAPSPEPKKEEGDSEAAKEQP